ncbi:MAG: Protein serine/threonine phosphatase PrpC, regulation of stationary phase, partial [uncultured Nocardioides sp.]
DPAPPLLRDLRRGARQTRQPGLGLRRPVVADRLRRRGRRRTRRPGLEHRRPGAAQAGQCARRRPAGTGGGSGAPRRRPDRPARRAGPGAQRHLHHGHRRPVRRREVRHGPPRRQPRLPPASGRAA